MTTASFTDGTMSAMGRLVTVKEDLASRRRYETLQRESFDGGDLASVRLQQLWFTRCSFRGADLRQATLDGCHFKLCDLRGANLSGASMTPHGLTNATDAKLDNAILRDLQLDEVIGWPITG